MHPEDVVSDGLFTEAADPGAFQGYAATTPPTSPTTLGSWIVESGEIELLGTVFASSPLGGRSVDLNESTPGTISQDLTVEVGKQYQVVFALTGNHNGGESVKDVRVSVDGQSEDFSHTASTEWSNSNPLWEHRSFTFTADDESATVRFQSLDTGLQGAIIADIQVIEIPQAVTAILNNDPTLSYDAATGKFYKVVTTATDVTTAMTNANGDQLNGIGGQLVNIRSAYENDLIRAMIEDQGSSFYIGATDATTEGEWNWIDGAETDRFWNGGAGGSTPTGSYSNWHPGEPSESGGEDYAAIRESDGLWLDLSGAGSNGYIIEWDASEVLSSFTFSLTDASNNFEIDSSTGEITVAATNTLDYETATSHDVDVTVTDAAGNVSAPFTMTIIVDNGIDPTQSVPGAQSVIENELLTFSSGNFNAVTVSDTVASTDTRLQVFISVNDGVLNLSQTTGLSILGGANGSSFMTIHGTESDINAAFEGMTFTPDTNFSGSVTLNMTTSLGADMVGQYTFDAGTVSGPTVSDQSVGLSQDGTITGATVVTDTDRGDVLLLDGTGDFVQIASTFGDPTSTSIGGWVNFTGSGRGEFISIDDRIHLKLDEAGVGIAGSIQTAPGVWNDLSSNVFISGTGWHHVMYVFDDVNDVHTLYLDGGEIASETTTDSIDWAGATTTYIGRHPAATYEFEGRIDDARIFSRALTGDEIAALAAEQTEASGTVAITVQAANRAPYFTSLPSADPQSVESLTGATSVSSGDFDNDGDVDLVSTTNTGELRWHENDGSGSFSASVLIASAQDFSAVAVFDLEGDGDMDIVALNDDPADAANSVFVLTNNFIGSGTVSFSTQSFEGAVGGESDGGQDLAIGDIDGDGRADIAGIFYRSIGDSQVVVFEQNSVGVWSKTYSDAVSNAHGIELVDLDGDSDLDIVTGDFQTREITWYENDGNATAGYSKQLIYDDVAEQMFDMTVGDFDADGDIDIAYITWGATDKIVMLENDGATNPSFTYSVIATETGSLLYHIDTADTNGDGTLDLIIVDESQNSILLYENDGTAAFTRNVLDADSRGPVWAEAADVDGDGENDIVFAARDDNFVGLHQNQGAGNYIRGTVNEDVSLGGLSVQIADDDAGTATMEVAINVVNGSIILNTSGVNVLSGGSSTSTITFEGTITNINTALNSITYSPTSDFNGLGEVQITVDDRGNTGVGGAQTATETLFIEVNAVNDETVIANIEGTVLPYTENDGAIAVTSTITFTDVDDTDIELAVVQITGGYNSGEDVLSFTDQNGISGSYNATNGTWTLTGSATLAQYQTAIRSITYTNTSENPDTTTRTVSFTVNDGDTNSNTQTRDITIASVNDDPTNAGSLPSDVTVTEDVLSNVDLSAVDFSDVDAGGSDLTVTLSTSTGGELTLAADGNLTFGGTATDRTITGTLANLNAYFNNTTNIQYLHGTPNSFGDNADTITVVFNDNGNTGTGGGNDQNLGTVNVDITAVNDAPVLDDSSSPVFTSVTEDNVAPVGAVGTMVSSLVDFASPSGQLDNVTDGESGASLGIAITEADATNGTWFYSIDNGTTWNALGAVDASNARLLAADANTRLYFQADANFAGTVADAITFHAWDQTSGTNGAVADVSENTVADQFSTVSYSNNDGTTNWGVGLD